MKTKLTVLLAMLMLLSCQIYSQDRQITGTVSSAEDGVPLPGVNVILKGSHTGTITNANGHYFLRVPSKGGILIFSFIGLKTQQVPISISNKIDVIMEADIQELSEIVVTGMATSRKMEHKSKVADSAMGASYVSPQPVGDFVFTQHNTEEYEGISENRFHNALRNPLSTFSIDVDAASYSNMRRFIQNGQQPPKDAVRIEELINYFDYDYPQPTGEDPFSITTEVSTAPWNEKHKLIHIGLQGKNMGKDKLPPSNLVFLIDVSGSMADVNKLPLLKSSFKLLVEQLREQDRIAIVVYAGAAGLVLPATSGIEKKKIIEALDDLNAGGSTAGGEGIQLAYSVAKSNFRVGGNNRVILATDGDFNVGESSNAAMEQLIEEKRKDGIFLTVMGFGMGNYKDSKMEVLADKGNGNYLYIDTILEAQKALVNEFGGTLFTIAKDVKLQIEFNPAKVKAYRLIGYENRMMKSEDFNNDKKDAGDLGSGHAVTALYEVIPVGVQSEFFKIDELKYQTQKVEKSAVHSDELMTVKFRYKKPDDDKSKLIVQILNDENKALESSSENFRWSAAVAAFGMIVRGSEFVNEFSLDQVQQLALAAKGQDKDGYRIEFLNLIRSVNLMARK